MNILDEANRLAGELADEFRRTMILEAETPSQSPHTIVAYSGHFQPFHEGHYRIYNVLVKKFGKDNVYITTTNQLDETENPLSYDDKKQVITKMFGIEDSKIQEVDNPFVPKEILTKFSPSNTSFVTVVDNEDVPTLHKSKYFHKYVDGQPLRTYKEAGYYLTVPELRAPVGNQALTGPQIMQVMGSPKTKPEVKAKLFQALYGKSNPEIQNLITKKAEAGAKEVDGEFDKTKAHGQRNNPKQIQSKAHGQTNNPDEIEGDEKTPPMKRMIVNPDTGREIKVQSALKYPRWKPVYKKAERVLKSAGIDRSDRVKEPEVNTRYKKRAKNKSNEDWSAYVGSLLSDEVQTIIKEFNLDEFGEDAPKSGGSGTQPVAIYSGRFQPFHAGHYHAYQDLVKKFGKDNVYIATSDKTNPENSPFDFQDKQNIITKMFGVDPSKVVQVKNPYGAEEIVSKLPPNTPVVWGLGKKDAARLAGSKKFKPYQDGGLTRFDPQGGYIYDVPQLDMKIGDKTISGTGVREVFAKGSPGAKKALFTKLYGKFDPQVFELVTDRVTNGPANPAPPKAPKKKTGPKPGSPKFSKLGAMDQSKTIKNPETGNDIKLKTALKYPDTHPAKKAARSVLKQYESITESFLIEGGAYGHLLHPYEDMDLTIGDLREMAKRALGTDLGKEGPVTEKTDGQNIMFTVRDGKVKFARSTKHLKNRGQEAMSPDELRQKFTGRGAIEQTFGNAGDNLQTAIEKMSPETVQKLFGDGRKFMSVEVIHPDSENTIPYGKPMLILHHTVEFDDAGKPQGHFPEDSDTMADALRDVQADQQKEFGIRGQQFIVFDDAEAEHLKEKLVKYNAELDVLENEYNLGDSSTLKDYKKAWWSKQLDEKGLPLSKEDKDLLINRWGGGDAKSNRLTKLSSPDAIAWAKQIESQLSEIDDKIIYPVQSFVARVGVDSLARVSDLLTSHNPQAGHELQQKLAQAIDTIRKSGDKDKLAEMDKFLKLVDDIGIEKILPSEGLLFSYGDKLYKFTGAFAPVHRIIAAVKFDKPKDTGPAPETPDLQAPKEPDVIPDKTSADIGGKKVKNPQTGNDILVKTALGYDKEHPAHKAAEKYIQKTETLSEGGNAVTATSKIPNQFAVSTATHAANALGIGGVDRALVGSTHKPLMNDLDVATDRESIRQAIGYKGTDKKEFFVHLKNYLEQKGLEVSLSPGFEQFSVSVPLVDDQGQPQDGVGDDGKPTGQPGSVQVDFMMGNLPWMKKYLTNGDQSEYSSTYRNVLIADALGRMVFDSEENPGVKWKYIINTRDGLEKVFFTEKPNGKKDIIDRQTVSSNPDDVAKILFGPKASFNDINTFEKLNKNMQSPNFQYPQYLPQIYQTFTDSITRMKKDMPNGIPQTSDPTDIQQQKKAPAAKPEPSQGISPEILNAKIKNPETKNDILVKTALKYDDSHPVKKAAVKFIQSKRGSK